MALDFPVVSPGDEFEAPNGKTYVYNSNNSWSILAPSGSSGGGGDLLPDFDTAGWPATHPGVPGYGGVSRFTSSILLFTDAAGEHSPSYSYSVRGDLTMRLSANWADPTIDDYYTVANPSRPCQHWRATTSTGTGGSQTFYFTISVPCVNFEGQYLRVWVGGAVTSGPQTALVRCHAGTDPTDGTIRHIDKTVNTSTDVLYKIIYRPYVYGPLGNGNHLKLEVPPNNAGDVYFNRYEILPTDPTL